MPRSESPFRRCNTPRAQANKDKSAFELTQQVSEVAQAVHDRRKAKNERRVLLVTAAKMRDDQNDFGPPQTNKRKKKKAAQLITWNLWFKRLAKYPGDKFDLLFDFAFADEVPVQDLLKQLFERADISRLDQMKDLLHYAGAGWGRRCFSSVATFLVESEPERELLLTAIEKGDGVMCSKWLLKLGYDDILLQLPFLDLLSAAQRDCSGRFADLNQTVPLLLCRALIGKRQRQMSGIKADNARTNPEPAGKPQI